jgi:hypothetical protein
MRAITVEPLAFAYVFALAMVSPLLQQYIYDELSDYHNFTKRESTKICKNNSVSDKITSLENLVQTQTSYWFIGLSLACKYCRVVYFVKSPCSLFISELKKYFHNFNLVDKFIW